MAYLLRSLIALMFLGIIFTALMGMRIITLPVGHIQLAIPAFLFTIFVQAFVMFYFIGVNRLVKNIHIILNEPGHDLQELFDNPPSDISKYKEKVAKFLLDTEVGKRQTIPWTMLMLVLGSIAFLLGGAYDTQVVSKVVHAGVVYGFMLSMTIGFFRQWIYLGKAHIILRKIKTLFSIPDGAM